CEVRHFTVPCLDVLRRSSTEMRAANIARAVDDDSLGRVADELNRFIREASAQTVVMPAVFGLHDSRPVDRLRGMVDGRVVFVPTMPMSVGGMRMQIRLRERFRELGGAYLLGDKVSRGVFDGNRLTAVYTDNFGYMKLSADHFIFAVGSFFGHGMESAPDTVFEPVFGLDVDAPAGRAGRCSDDLFSAQEYMTYGVVTDDDFNVYRGGRRVENFYAVGSALSGCNSIKEGSGAGVALMTAMKVADDILNKTKGGSQR
ncbi:MAG: anaerobic glycerol-3-phosphate dehydrogenase subunit B, partial [Muribaculaceae bacterium]|nr:anaerobic glycerol-3-phosphate dehydrogenase subunit B [Muribaculaceae bacterium]